MSNQQAQSLVQFSVRVANVVTELNDLILSIVNDEIEEKDFNNDLSEIYDQLAQVEGAVSELSDVFFSC